MSKNLKKRLTGLHFTAYEATRREEFTVGTVLKLKDGSIKVVGDVNTLLGVCDDCTEFKREDIKEVAHIKQLL